MSFKLVLNNEIIYEYSQVTHPARLRRFFDEIERDLSAGINLVGEAIESPTDLQKFQYISMMLFDALEKNNQNLVEVLSAFISTRCNEIDEINIQQQGDVFNLSLR